MFKLCQRFPKSFRKKLQECQYVYQTEQKQIGYFKMKIIQ